MHNYAFWGQTDAGSRIYFKVTSKTSESLVLRIEVSADDTSRTTFFTARMSMDCIIPLLLSSPALESALPVINLVSS